MWLVVMMMFTCYTLEMVIVLWGKLVQGVVLGSRGYSIIDQFYLDKGSNTVNNTIFHRFIR